MKICIIIVLTVLLAAQSSWAEMYQWIGEDGSVTFKDTPPPASKKRKKPKVYTDADFAPAPPPQPAGSAPARHTKDSPSPQDWPAPKKERFTGTIEMYVTDWCRYCKAAESYMRSKNYPYVKYDIEKDSSAKRRHKELGGRGVPLIIIGTNKMSGFTPENLEYYMDKP